MKKDDAIEYLNRWYSRLRSRYVDLIGDFGGSELFVVEGDSLLYEFFCDSKKHFLDFNQPYGGGQFLSLTYLVETFLNKLKQRGCVFHLVFFHKHKVIWNSNPKFRIAREIIINHLKSCQNESKVPIYEFPAWWDSQFDQYIDDRQPLFILSGDGTNGDKEKSTKISILSKGLFYYSLHKDLSMALIPGMEFRDSRAQAFVFDRGGNVEPSTIENLPGIVELCSIESQESYKKSSWTNPKEQNFETNSLISEILNEQENQKIFENGGKRLFFVIISLIDLLKQNSKQKIYRLLSKLFLLHIYLLDYTTLQSRTLPPIQKINAEVVNKFLNSFYNCCCNILINDSLKIANVKNNFADFVDIRLFISLIELQQNGNIDFNNLPKEIKQDFDIAWKILARYDNKVMILDGLLNNIQIEKTAIPIYANRELSLLPFDYQFFVEILGDMQLKLNENDTGIIDTDRYARSLNGTQGFYKLNIIIDKKADKKSQNKLSNKAIKIIEQANQDKLEKSFKDAEASFARTIEELPIDLNIESKLSYLNDRFNNKDKFKHPKIMLKIQIYKLQLLFDQWNKDSQNFGSTIEDQKNYLSEILEKLGLNDSKNRLLTMFDTNELKESNKKESDKKESGKKKSNKKEGNKKENNKKENKKEQKSEEPGPSADLSLGHLMDRNTNSVEDKRVQHFKPDKWQCDVLDVIDKNQSALVCCPTSSGKTFISFYAMEKVLREDDDGILVYVSPTKALVNQVTAEVYGRFEKTYTQGGKTVWGIRTREYNQNHDKCQILVTVPEMLEILLLSPSNVKWVTRIRRIILDEVHCIGEMDGGSTWESLLLLAQCPILALSATIGNPEPFSKWIEKIQTTRGHKTKLIKTTKRFSDLQQYVFIPKFPLLPLVETTVKPKEELRQDCLISIHPFSAMSSVVIAESGIPADLKLLPSHCIELWDAMNHVHKDDPDLLKINPDKYFKDIGYIVKDNADNFETDIKKLFISWTRNKPKMAKAVIKNLGDDIKKRFDELESTAKINNEKLDIYDESFFKIAIIPLLCELSAQDKLPAILFSFDRNNCNHLAINILKELESAEEQKRRNDPIFEIIFDYEAHDPNFTFVNPKYRMPSDEFQALIRTFEHKMTGKLSKLLDALKRGIGVHHAGLPKKYLGAVEILFRRRHLSIVIATGTLALGINMPCRTTVFVGDSTYLTPLQYRQMSGRSGRRGYDPIGHVVFFGITLTKIKRLLTSELPAISGHFPLTTSLVLRMFILLTNSENPNYSEKAVSGLFGDSFFCLGKEHLSGQIKHHLRFSIEYLRRENILDEKGKPINLSGMISHLYYTEPSNFAMAALFKHGVFHKICSEIRTNPTRMMENLMLILSHLFNRKKLRKVDKRFYSEILEKYPSKIFLQKLPKNVRKILKDHNKRILEIHTDYVIAFTRQNMKNLGPDNRLPLSKVEFPPKQLQQNKWDLIKKLNSMAIPFSARTPFIAMCGSIGDNFLNIEDLCEHIHHKIYLDLYSIPYIKVNENLNAYLMDFFSHGQEKTLNLANGIRPGEVWQCLKDFDFVLQTIVTSLEVRKVESEANVLDGFKMVSESFREKFVTMWA
ncbi:16854_t:CDS:10 [Cetraspora pellucida]|uniref:16854_t:CDS:1 n=1 Tax=Cetraspora pellucida TaxID=1433469 RepID=A0A9N8VM94_9GLOM|nr:16854_t:CDS:10 [Cetraspora pellucida]